MNMQRCRATVRQPKTQLRQFQRKTAFVRQCCDPFQKFPDISDVQRESFAMMFTLVSDYLFRCGVPKKVNVALILFQEVS